MATSKMSIGKLLLTLGFVSTLGSLILIAILLFYRGQSSGEFERVLSAYDTQIDSLTLQEDVIHLLSKALSIAASSGNEDLTELTSKGLGSGETQARFERVGTFLGDGNTDLNNAQALFNSLEAVESNLRMKGQERYTLLDQQRAQVLVINQLQSDIVVQLDEVIGKSQFTIKRVERRVKRALKNNGDVGFNYDARFFSNLNQMLEGADADIITTATEIRTDFLTLFSRALQISGITNQGDLLNVLENQVNPVLKRLPALSETLRGLLVEKGKADLAQSLTNNLELFVNEAFEGTASLAKLQASLINANAEKQSLLSDMTETAPNLVSGIDLLAGKIGEMSKQARADSAKREQRVFQTAIVFGLVTVVAVLALCFFCYTLIQAAIKTVNASLRTIAHGDRDLTKRMPSSKVSELDQLSLDFNQFVAKIQHTIKSVDSSLGDLGSAVQASEKCSGVVTTAAEDQHQQVDMASVATEQLTSSIATVASHANQAADEAASTKEEAMHSLKIVEQSKEAIIQLSTAIQSGSENMAALKQASEKMKTVLSVIVDIAEQTNLLALNAAIEAARAGEQGRGFAVVADEVRGLASRTQDSTKEISRMIGSLHESSDTAQNTMLSGVEQANKTVELVSDAYQAFEKIVSAIQTISQYNVEIASSTDQQSEATQEIANMVLTVRKSTELASDSAESLGNSNARVSMVSGELNQLVNGFRI